MIHTMIGLRIGAVNKEERMYTKPLLVVLCKPNRHGIYFTLGKDSSGATEHTVSACRTSEVGLLCVVPIKLMRGDG